MSMDRVRMEPLDELDKVAQVFGRCIAAIVRAEIIIAQAEAARQDAAEAVARSRAARAVRVKRAVLV